MSRQQVDVRQLATLSRLEVTDEELAKLETELPAILDFVEQIQAVATDVESHDAEHRNVMRDDANPIETGSFTDVLLAAAPKSRDGRVAVKQVISRKK